MGYRKKRAERKRTTLVKRSSNPNSVAPAVRITLSCPIPVRIVGIIGIAVSSVVRVAITVAISSPVTAPSVPSATEMTAAVTTATEMTTAVTAAAEMTAAVTTATVTATAVTATPSVRGAWNSYNGHNHTKHHDQ